jgi:hypothetical protein
LSGGAHEGGLAAWSAAGAALEGGLGVGCDRTNLCADVALAPLAPRLLARGAARRATPWTRVARCAIPSYGPRSLFRRGRHDAGATAPSRFVALAT